MSHHSDLIDTTEMYLRTVYELEEEGVVPLRARIAERLGQSGPTVSQTVARMERDGLLHVADDRHLELSEKGRHEAVGVMRKQIDHHLQRARIAAAVSVVGTVTEIAPVIEGLVRAMEKIHAVKRLKITVQVDPALRFRGEKQDIEEMTGNLIDNACKWAISEVMIRTEAFHLDGAMFARITIDDDGPGLSPEKRAEAGQRGKRLDETKPGTGLGLAIVQDLVSLYGGRFNLDEAPIGGLRAILDIPALQGPVPTAGARPSSRSGEGATV